VGTYPAPQTDLAGSILARVTFNTPHGNSQCAWASTSAMAAESFLVRARKAQSQPQADRRPAIGSRVVRRRKWPASPVRGRGFQGRVGVHWHALGLGAVTSPRLAKLCRC